MKPAPQARPLPLGESLGSVRVSPALILWLLGVAAVIFSREFPGSDGPSSSMYGLIPGALGLRWVDGVILAAAYVVAAASFARQRHRSHMSHGMRRSLALFAVATCLSLVYGHLRGGTQLFYEWRNLLLGAAVWYLTLKAVRRVGAERAAWWLFLILGGRAALLLVLWLGGARRVGPFAGPVWDGPTISSAVGALALGSIFLMRSKGFWTLACWLLVIASGAVVLFSFRRTYWGELAVTVGVLLVFGGGRRVRVAALMALVAALALVSVPGDLFYFRIRSLNPIDSTSPLATTNRFHVDDVLDAWDIVRQHPVLGIGQGTPYQTTRLASQKSESWGVHNALLHVWLRFGLVGLIAYVWFHLSGFRWALGAGGGARVINIPVAVGAYWLGTFVPSLGFSPWPYGALQNSVLVGALLALVERSLQEREKRDSSTSFTPTSFTPVRQPR